jgi:GTPase SAR1 family protein
LRCSSSDRYSDITSQPSFQDTREWLSEFRQREQPTSLIVLSANEADLVPQRKIIESEIQTFAEDHQIDVVKEISAVGVRVVELFDQFSG